jgi:hypothetical protein
MTTRDNSELTDDELIVREDDELLTVGETCAFIGGKTKPIDPATLYRGIKAGIWPPLFHPSPGISRAVKRQYAAARARRARIVAGEASDS